MAPPGIKFLLHERPEDHGSWFPHALSGWYICPSIEHYPCHQIWIPATNSVRIGQSVSWFPHKLIMPTDTATDIIIVTSKDLTVALRQLNKNPLLPPSDTITRNVLSQLDSIFSNSSSALKPRQPPHFWISKGVHSKTALLHLQGCLHPLHRIFTISPLQQKTSQRSSSRQFQSFSRNITFFFSINQIEC